MRIQDISITKKIFLLTASVFVLYLAANVLGQTLFYEKVYTHQKQHTLSVLADDFMEEYAVMDEQEQINQKIVEYSNEDNVHLLVMNEDGNIVHAVSYELVLEKDDGTRLRLQLDSAAHDPAFRSFELAQGDRVSVEYVSRGGEGGDVLYMPSCIWTADAQWKMRHENDPPFMPEVRQDGKQRGMLQTAEGTVVSVTLPTKETGSMIDRAQLMRAVWLWSNGAYDAQKREADGSVHYIYESTNRYIVNVKPIEKKGEKQTIIAVTTLEPVREAAQVMQKVQMLWLLFGIAVIMLLCFAFSRYLTKPIVNISKVTSKMKQLDFSEKCHIHSYDELGQLAQNVNSMSDILDRTIAELRAANEKLRLDIERERDVEKNRREFVAAVSHELKTPLAIIRAYSEAINDGVSANKQERYINIIVDETKKMDALVLDMLENSKLELGTQKLNIKQHNICDLIQKIVHRFEKNIADKQIAVRQDFLAERIISWFDRDRLEQVITNFITNAIRHTPEGGAITLCAVEKTDGVYVCVENEGAHIAQEELERVWDRFYRIDKSRERALGGTGLGLSIAKNILVLHHAEYGAENIDHGVRFWFRLKNDIERSENTDA